MSTSFRRADPVQASADTTPFDISIPGEGRTPVGAILFATLANALNSDLAIANLAIGFTDFTNAASVSNGADNAVATTDTSCRHDPGKCLALVNAGATTVNRSFTCTAAAGKITVTPDGSGAAIQIVAVLIFGTSCLLVDDGDGDASFNVNYTGAMSNEPKIFIGAFSNCANEGNTQGDISFGFATNVNNVITQRSMAIRMQNAQANGESHMRICTDRVVDTRGNAGTTIAEFAITAVDDTNVTFTGDGEFTPSGNVIGLLIEAADLDVAIVDADSPDTADSDYVVDGVGFTPQLGIALLNSLVAWDTSVSDNAISGSMSIAVFDDGAVAGVSISDDNGADPSATESRTQTTLYHPNDQGNVEYRMSNPQMNSDGVEFAAADIVTASATTHKWSFLFIQQAATATVVNRVLTSTAVVTDPVEGTQFKRRGGGDRIETLNDAIFLYSALGVILTDTFDVEDGMELLGDLDQLLFDTMNLQDFNAVTRFLFRSITHLIQTSDDHNISLRRVRRLTDILLSDDQIIKRYLFSRQLSNTIMPQPLDTISKSIQREGSSEEYVILLEDYIPIEDLSQIVFSGVSVRQRTDSISLAEADVLSRFRNRQSSESLSMDDFTVRKVSRRDVLDDGFVVTDTKTFRRRRVKRPLDTLQSTDAHSKYKTRNVRMFRNDYLASDDEDNPIILTDDQNIQMRDFLVATRSSKTFASTLLDELTVQDAYSLVFGSTLPPPTDIITGIEVA